MIMLENCCTNILMHVCSPIRPGDKLLILVKISWKPGSQSGTYRGWLNQVSLCLKSDLYFWQKLKLKIHAIAMELHYNGINIESKFSQKDMDHIDKFKTLNILVFYPSIYCSNTSSYEEIYLQNTKNFTFSLFSIFIPIVIINIRWYQSLARPNMVYVLQLVSIG